MSFYQKKYSIISWNKAIYILTAKQLYERVLNDSKSDFNWIASATELTRICNKDSFPKVYATKIKILILNCFANLELKKEHCFHCEPSDILAVYSCYNSLSCNDEDSLNAKNNFLKAVIQSVIKYTDSEVRLPIYFGPTYTKLCNEWKEEKFNEFSSKETINFEKLRSYLYIDFDSFIEKCQEDGILDENDNIFKAFKI